jgi:hypothetical protein
MFGWVFNWQGLLASAAVGALLAGYITYRVEESAVLRLQVAGQEAIIKAQNSAKAEQAQADKITHDNDVLNALAHQKIVTNTVHILQKVPVYVSAQTDSAFPLNCGWLRLHDAAASGADPATISLPTGKSDTDICPVAASTAASIIAANYELALGWRQDAITWQSWYDAQAATYNKLASGH